MNRRVARLAAAWVLAGALTACSASATSSPATVSVGPPSTQPVTQPATRPATQPAILPATQPGPSGTVPPSSPAATPPLEVPAPTAAAGAAVPAVDARAYVVYDEATGQRLASHHADQRLAVGSLMKLLNAHVAYAAGEPDQLAVAPDGLLGVTGESVIGLYPGQQISRSILIRAMLKVSANDAARLLALDIAGSEAAYAEQMNAAAAALGLVNTQAVNASGLDADGQFSSADDMVTLGAQLLQNPTFRQTVSEPTASLNGQSFQNTNDLLGAYRGADGIKTGHTTDAGWCLLASATRDGRRVVVAVLGASSEQARDQSARALLDWGFAQL